MGVGITGLFHVNINAYAHAHVYTIQHELITLSLPPQLNIYLSRSLRAHCEDLQASFTSKEEKFAEPDTKLTRNGLEHDALSVRLPVSPAEFLSAFVLDKDFTRSM